MNGDYTERLSQESECREAGQYGILDEASAVALGVLEEIETLAGTTACHSTLVFIDTIIYPSDTGGYETYCSLSPRCSKQ